MDTKMLPDIATKLFPNFWTWIVQICATGILLLLFKKYLWKPMLAYFEKRADFIEKNINDSKQMRDEASKYLKEADKQARDSAREYQDIVNQAKEEANIQKQKILDEAQDLSRRKINQAEAEILAEKAKAQESMKEEIVDIATLVATKIINKEMDSNTNDEMVQKFVDEVMN